MGSCLGVNNIVSCVVSGDNFEGVADLDRGHVLRSTLDLKAELKAKENSSLFVIKSSDCTVISFNWVLSGNRQRSKCDKPARLYK